MNEPRVDGYLVPAAPCETAIVVHRSRFIATVTAAASVAAAQQQIGLVKQRYSDATHHCFAYRVGPPTDLSRIGCSDAGEPKGTAGRPLLHIVTHSPVGDLLVVVTRYFGGVKLGTGGLQRAYSEAVKQGLAAVTTTRHMVQRRVRIAVDYGHWGQVERRIAQGGLVVEDSAFGERVVLVLRGNAEQVAAFCGDVNQVALVVQAVAE